MVFILSPDMRDGSNMIAPAIGVSATLMQCILSFFFTRCKGPWQDEPGFSAHQVVTFLMMSLVSIVGWQGWIADSPEDRVYGLHAPSQFLVQLTVSYLVVWEFPTMLLVKSLRSPEMVLHHVAMLLVCIFMFGKPLWSFYACFFIGWSEVTSLLLVIVEQFHKKRHPAWHACLQAAPPVVQGLYSACSIGFAVSFLVVRGIGYPLVGLHDGLRYGDTIRPSDLVMSIVFASTFVALQLYWSMIIVRQLWRRCRTMQWMYRMV